LAPYLITIIVLVGVIGKSEGPAANGKTYNQIQNKLIKKQIRSKSSNCFSLSGKDTSLFTIILNYDKEKNCIYT